MIKSCPLFPQTSQTADSKRGSAYVLGTAESDASDAGDVLQAELANGLSGLLLVARVDGDGGASGDGGLVASLGLRGAGGILNASLLGLLVVDLFNAGVGHCDD